MSACSLNSSRALSLGLFLACSSDPTGLSHSDAGQDSSAVAGSGGSGGVGGWGGAGGAAGKGGTSGSGGAAGQDGGVDYCPLVPCAAPPPGCRSTGCCTYSCPDGGADLCGPYGPCQMLENGYAAALREANQCTTLNATGQCLLKAPAGLSCGGGCSVWVNSTYVLDKIRAQWVAAGCAKSCQPTTCPAPCPPLTKGVCAAPTTVTTVAPLSAAGAPAPVIQPPPPQAVCVNQR